MLSGLTILIECNEEMKFRKATFIKLIKDLKPYFSYFE